MTIMTRSIIPASFFGIVLGLSGMGQAWRVAVPLWGMPQWIGEGLLMLASLVWLILLVLYVIQAMKYSKMVRDEFLHPVQGSTPALIAVATLLIAIAAIPYSRTLAYILTASGIGWHLFFSFWHSGKMWQGGQNALDLTPSLYLPTVAGNFISAAALGALGHNDFGWIFLGVGLFSWLALESLMLQRFFNPQPVPPQQRALLGIQFAPPVVCAMAWLILSPDSTDHWLLMLWGYGLYQLLLGIRMKRWLGAQPFSAAYWAYSFGVAAATITGLKLALAGVGAAQLMAIPIFIVANVFIAYLLVRSAYLLLTGRLFPPRPV
jgi:tellurite resistance protein